MNMLVWWALRPEENKDGQETPVDPNDGYALTDMKLDNA